MIFEPVYTAQYSGLSLRRSERRTNLENKTVRITGSDVNCSYCGRQVKFYVDGDRENAYCSEECRQLHQKALRKIKKSLKWFFSGICASVLLLVAGAFFKTPSVSQYLAGSGMALLGITLILFPFCTPETYRKFGYVKSAGLGRLLGVLTAVFGVVILLRG